MVPRDPGPSGLFTQESPGETGQRTRSAVFRHRKSRVDNQLVDEWLDTAEVTDSLEHHPDRAVEVPVVAQRSVRSLLTP